MATTSVPTEPPPPVRGNAYRESGGGHRAAADSLHDAPRYWCVNQELHHRKALLFDDHETVIQIVRDRFELNRTDESAEIWLLDKLNKCEDTFITAFSDTLHNTGLYFN